MSNPIDPGTIIPGQTVQLVSVSGGTTSPVALASVNSSTAADELQLFPEAPLEPGNYEVQLAGDATGGQPVLASPAGVPLGEDAQHPDGADESFVFQVDGIDGVPGATASDDTAATAQNLGDVTGQGIVQVAGAIGDDPLYDPATQTRTTSSRNTTRLTRWTSTTSRSSDPDSTPCSPRSSRAGSARRWTPASASSSWIRATGNSSFSQATTTRSRPRPRVPTGRTPLFTDSALHRWPDARRLLRRGGRQVRTRPRQARSDQMPGSPGIFDPNQPGSRPARIHHGPVPPEPDGPADAGSADGRGLVAVTGPGPEPVPHADHRAVLGARRPPATRVSVLRGDLRQCKRRSPEVFVEAARTGRSITRASSITTASRTRPRSRCSTACRTARLACTSRARAA